MMSSQVSQEFSQNFGALVANPSAFSVLLIARSGIARYGSIDPETSVLKFGPCATWGEGPNSSRLFIVNDIQHGRVRPDGRKSSAALVCVPQACMEGARRRKKWGNS